MSIRAGHGGSEALVQVVRNLDFAHIEPRGLALRRPSLDDVFLAITGHAAEEEGEPATGQPSQRGGRGGSQAATVSSTEERP